MLHIYTGREDIDKQRWMFARIKEQDRAAGRKRGVFLIVPDQFTLEAERSAFAYMDVPAFINPVVLSMNRLAGKVLAEAGESTEHIDRYGNYMLLARLLYRNRDGLELYRNLENSTGFIAQLSEAIMSLKSHLVTPKALAECAETADTGGGAGVLLGKKLRDVAALYAEYEDALAGGLPDGADITRRFLERIPGSGLLKDAALWIFGFDYFSPLYLKAIGTMAAGAEDVSVVLTAEAGDASFALTNGMAEKLADAAREAGAEWEAVSVKKDADARGIECGYLPEEEKPPEIAHIERTLFAGPVRPYSGRPQGTPRAAAMPEPEPHLRRSRRMPELRLVVAQNAYYEAEAAAQAVVRLVREEGLRFRDILVICNDQERRAPAIQRVFSAYGIETFLDKRHEAGYNPVLAYITALPEIVSRGRRAEDVLRWIGSGLTDVSEGDAEELENYTERYGLRGGAWHKPLARGKDVYNEEIFARIENTVKYAGGMIGRFSERFGVGSGPASARTARARTDGLKKFLEEDARLPEKIEAYANRLEEDGFLEYAARMRGIWDVALGIFAQTGAALGDVATSADEYATILKAGFASVMMGVLPASSDSVTIGTMQRTRTGHVKAMFVLGANDGELPMYTEDAGLLDDTEKETLEGLGLTAFRREENLHDEEQLAIYKNLSKPTRLLHVSYTAFSADGGAGAEASRIFERLRALFPETPLEKDEDVITGERPRLQNKSRFEADDCVLGAEGMRSLIPPVLSPTAVEKYSRCPFSFLMDRGLKLRDIRKYEIDSRGMGDVYHEALKLFGEAMNRRGGAPKEEGSAWNTASREETDAIVDEVFCQLELSASGGGGEAKSPEGGRASGISEEGALLFDADNPAAVYRLRRLQSIVRDVCRALTERAAGSGAERIIFETGFGRGGEFDTLCIGGADEDGLQISGRIDRIDVLPGGRAKVLDYKSGAEKWNAADVKNGWQLQLMIYLKAIEKAYEPAGVSYFRIFEPRINLSGLKEKKTPDEIMEAVLGQYRSDGVSLEVPEEGTNGKRAAGGEKRLSGEEFDLLRKAADERLSEIAASLAKGEAPARPKQKTGGEPVTACTYCNYKSICNIDII